MNLSILISNLYLYIYIYIFSFLSLTLFLFLIDLNKLFSNIISFNLLSTNNFKKYNFYFFISSFVGIPPFLGFFNKLFLFFNLLFYKNNIIFLFFLVINVFLLVFYIQQIRFVQSNFKKIIFFKRYEFNHSFIVPYIYIIIFQLINIFSIFFLPFLFFQLPYILFI